MKKEMKQLRTLLEKHSKLIYQGTEALIKEDEVNLCVLHKLIESIECDTAQLIISVHQQADKLKREKLQIERRIVEIEKDLSGEISGRTMACLEGELFHLKNRICHIEDELQC